MGKVAQEKTVIHVIFTLDGLPGWFGPEPVLGSEPLDLDELRPLLPKGASDRMLAAQWRDLMIRHCRVDGRWIARSALLQAEDEAAEAEPVASAAADPDASAVAASDETPALRPRQRRARSALGSGG